MASGTKVAKSCQPFGCSVAHTSVPDPKASMSCVDHVQRKKALTETDKSCIFDRDFICLDLLMKDGSLKQAMKDGTVQAHQHPYKHCTAVVDFATLEPSQLHLRRMRLSMKD